MKRLIIAAILIFGFSSPAMADHCRKDIRIIQAALQGQNNAKAEKLLTKGRKLHKAGKHDEAETALHQAMKMLGIKH